MSQPFLSTESRAISPSMLREKVINDDDYNEVFPDLLELIGIYCRSFWVKLQECQCIQTHFLPASFWPAPKITSILQKEPENRTKVS